MQDDYIPEDPGARFLEIDRMASIVFGTKRWKSDFARRYGLTYQGVSKWSREGAPIWAYVAIKDAHKVSSFNKTTEMLRQSNEMISIFLTSAEDEMSNKSLAPIERHRANLSNLEQELADLSGEAQNSMTSVARISEGNSKPIKPAEHERLYRERLEKEIAREKGIISQIEDLET